jgi:hypothetical protein
MNNEWKEIGENREPSDMLRETWIERKEKNV